MSLRVIHQALKVSNYCYYGYWHYLTNLIVSYPESRSVRVFICLYEQWFSDYFKKTIPASCRFTLGIICL